MCFGGNSITINVLPSPTLSVAQSPSTVCSGKNLIVSTTGANTYTYFLGGSSSTLNPIALIAPSVNSLTTNQFTISGSGSNGCISAVIYTLAVNPNPTVSVSASSPTVCVGSSATLSASGADTYLWWDGSSISNSNPYIYTATVAGVQQFTAAGTTLAGCTGTASISFTANNCNLVGIEHSSAEPLNVFPNPFQNQLHIKGQTGYIRVINMLGQIICNTTLQDALIINTENWSKGHYTIQVLGENQEVLNATSVVKP